MKLLVFSDIHGGSILPLKKYLDSCDGVIFLGDGEDCLEQIKDKPVYAVRGNCDGFSSLPAELEARLSGQRLLLCHGHKYYVKHSSSLLLEEARSKGCAAALFGHTHNPCCAYSDGVYLLNPGAASGINPTCGILELSKSGIMFSVIDIKKGTVLL